MSYFSYSVNASNCFPVNDRFYTSSASTIPISLAIDSAVSFISPVIILENLYKQKNTIMLIPASLHFLMDYPTPGLGGSYKATRPSIIGSFSNYS